MVVNAILSFVTVLSIEPAVKAFSPPATHSMPDAWETGRDNSFFTAGAKMDACATVRSHGESSYHH